MTAEPNFDFDVNATAAAFLKANLDRMIDGLSETLKGVKGRFITRLRSGYSDYMATIAKNHSKTKSFFVRDEPAYLYDTYVPVDLSIGDRILENAQYNEIQKVSQANVLCGGAGCGKTVLLKHLLLNCIKSGGKLPVYVQLRDLNRSEVTIIESVKDSLTRDGLKALRTHFETAMELGHFAILLDGFDEIAHHRRDELAREIRELPSYYPKADVIVTSRPDRECESWENYTNFHVVPLTVDKACKLVSSLPIDRDLRTRFTRDLRMHLYSRHESFLSNPLLLSIMVLTYGENAEIPEKVSLFYQQAYDALFHRHDALKTGFRRDRKTKLDIMDFGRVFSAFSLRTYNKRELHFPRPGALEHLERCRTIVGLEFKTSDFLDDAHQAVSLLVEDGLELTYAHRSFQEYFVARFIKDAKPDQQKKLLYRFLDTPYHRTDSVLRLTYEMAEDLVERTLIIPEMTKLRKKIGFRRRVTMPVYHKFLSTMANEVCVRCPGERTNGYGWIGNNTAPIEVYCLVFWKYVRKASISDRESVSKANLMFCRTYCDDERTDVRFKPHELGQKSRILRDFAALPGILSADSLEKVLETERHIQTRHLEADGELDDWLR
ncbi:MAG TPA: NACHT domain-containing protein [candidate division Zixibacteria bacterium]|nr:NACHT domain-containing protein [candidate division Zixibacteria bacterium]